LSGLNSPGFSGGAATLGGCLILKQLRAEEAAGETGRPTTNAEESLPPFQLRTLV